MASPTKKARSDAEESVVGFIHGLSPVKISKKNTRYFDGTLQTGREEYHRVVVFGAEKRTVFEQAAMAKTPVKLLKVKKSISYSDPSGYDVLCSGDSELQVVENPQFFFRGPPTASTMTLKSVLALGPKFNVHAVRVKILPGGIQSRVVPVDGVPRELKQYRVCDPTGVTKLTMWEDKILLVQLSHSYEICNLATRRYGEQTFLTSTPSTTVQEIKDIGEPDDLQPDVDEGDLDKVSGCVSGVQITARHHCGRCRATQADFNTACTSHRCDRCRMLQRASSYPVVFGGTVVIDRNGEEQTLTITNSAISEFVAEYMGGVATDSDAIEEKLIGLDVELQANSSQLVTSLSLREGNDAV